MTAWGLPDVLAAADRIRGTVRPVCLSIGDPADALVRPRALLFACEFMQHTGSFKARGAANFIAAHREAATMPAAGVTIASGGNAGVACAWAAQLHGVQATVFVPETAPQGKIRRLREYGADLRLVGTEYADAAVACDAYAARSGAVKSHAYDDPLIAAGAGTLMLEILASTEPDTVIVAVGGGGLYSGLAAVAAPRGVGLVAVEPSGAPTLHDALAAGRPVDVPVHSIAADALGARRVTPLALQVPSPGLQSLLVDDTAIEEARNFLWHNYRIAVEHAAATALAALRTGAYSPAEDERVVVILCGANTDPTTLEG